MLDSLLKTILKTQDCYKINKKLEYRNFILYLIYVK